MEKTNTFFIEGIAKSWKLQHKDMVMDSKPVVTDKVEFGYRIKNQWQTLEFPEN